MLSFDFLHCIEIDCTFKYKDFHWGRSDYICQLININNEAPNTLMTSVTGEHLPNHSNENVTAVQISDGNFKYVPVGFGNFFNFTHYGIASTNVKQIRNSDFNGLQDLTLLDIYKNPLKTVPENLFKNLCKVTILSPSSCEIKNLPTKLFNDLTEIEQLFLYGNDIEELNKNLFANNLKLEKVLLDRNRIKMISEDLFKPLINLKILKLNNNECIDEDLSSGESNLKFYETVNYLCKPIKSESSNECQLKNNCDGNLIETLYVNKEHKRLLVEEKNMIKNLANIQSDIEIHESKLIELRYNSRNCEKN